MKLNIKIITALFLLVLAGCVKDNSVVLSRELDNIVIQGVAENYVASIDDVLSIQPAIQKAFTKDADLEYLWYAYTQTSQYVADTLSKEKNLATTISMPPGTYSLVFKVTDKTTGVFYKALSTLNVVNDYTTGIIVLAENDGHATVHFLNTTSGKFIEEVYEKGNGGEIAGSEPVSVSFYPQRSQMPSEILILCRDQQGGVIVNPSTFTRIRTLRNSFIVPWEGEGVINTQGYVERFSGLQDYVIIDGKPHNRAVNSAELLFRPAMLGDFYLYPAAFNEGATRSGFYDTRNMRFLCHNTTTGSLNPFLAGTTTSIIDPNNVGLKIVYGGKISANEYFGVFENAASTQRYLLAFRMNSAAQTFIARSREVLNAENIMEANAFASSIGLSNYLFYSTGSKIYVYNLTTRNGGMLLDLGTGVNINLLKMNGTELKVAFTNAALPGKKGGFITYNITTLGGITANQKVKKEGFCDKVVDLTDKQ
ncbi:PKD-like family lipoprotein [Chitinophaga sp. sic0106]|uniref:PKD-like family lipoprotein n=1 Tax=Chitinophaga sp. sic0106 TaxID=2854785 RepID=UPI001C48F9FB|nr:PKD-like family lipoprotein [Chitinophaga sp. sic0106]MBV7533011.1 hypothetical protein [Chitinophaga sp. sic0106]